MPSAKKLPLEIIQLARLIPGPLPPSYAIAQAILETGWFRSSLYSEGNNPFGMKSSISPEFSQYESGVMKLTPGPDSIEYSKHSSLERAFRKRDALLSRYMRNGLDTLESMMSTWCPDPGYLDKLKAIRSQERLERFDAPVKSPKDKVEEIPTLAWQRFLEAMLQIPRFGKVVQLALTFPKYVEDAERSGKDGPGKLEYVVERVYDRVDDALGIPWFLDSWVKQQLAPLVAFVVEKYNAYYGKDWGNSENTKFWG